LYFAASTEAAIGDPHVSQNRAPNVGVAPHDRHCAGEGVFAAKPTPSTD
jgi:hypothetical protein